MMPVVTADDIRDAVSANAFRAGANTRPTDLCPTRDRCPRAA